MVVEDDAQIARGVEAVTALRREGFSAELVASGSPRKRFDKAVKMGAGAIASISTVEGAAKISVRAEDALAARIESLLL